MMKQLSEEIGEQTMRSCLLAQLICIKDLNPSTRIRSRPSFAENITDNKKRAGNVLYVLPRESLPGEANLVRHSRGTNLLCWNVGASPSVKAARGEKRKRGDL